MTDMSVKPCGICEDGTGIPEGYLICYGCGRVDRPDMSGWTVEDFHDFYITAERAVAFWDARGYARIADRLADFVGEVSDVEVARMRDAIAEGCV